MNELIIDFVHYNEAPEGYFGAAMGWYFHGELETLVGYDIPSASVDLMTLDDGIYKGTYKGLSCTFFCWHSVEFLHPDRRKKWHHGLIVLDTDVSSLTYANFHYNKRGPWS